MNTIIMKRVRQFPVIISLLAFGMAMPLLWGVTYPLLTKLPFYWAGAVRYALSFCVTTGISFVIYRGIPFPYRCEEFFRGLFSFGALGIICAVMAFVFSYDKPDTIPTISTMLGFVCYNLAIAVSEEWLFRGLIGNVLWESRKGRKGAVWFSVTVSSIIFGLRHFLNLIAKPETVVSTTGQVIFTFMAGFYLCAIYLRTGNIWICVFIHFLEDFLTGFWGVVSTSAAAVQHIDSDIKSTVLLVAVHSVYVIFGIFMIKGKNEEEIL